MYVSNHTDALPVLFSGLVQCLGQFTAGRERPLHGSDSCDRTGRYWDRLPPDGWSSPRELTLSTEVAVRDRQLSVS
jgi:hypothetical protein